MADSTPFQLSRIYASGWSAGRKCIAEDFNTVAALAHSLNPYQAPDAYERWSQGFLDAVRHDHGTPASFYPSHFTNGDNHGKRSET